MIVTETDGRGNFWERKLPDFNEIVDRFLKRGWNLEVYANESSVVSMACQLDDGGNQINDEVFEDSDWEKSVLGLIELCYKNHPV